MIFGSSNHQNHEPNKRLYKFPSLKYFAVTTQMIGMDTLYCATSVGTSC
jgi:hypothetical protein